MRFLSFVAFIPPACVVGILHMVLTLITFTAAAVSGLIAHTVSMVLRTKGFLDDCRLQLKQTIETFEESLSKDFVKKIRLEAGMYLYRDPDF